MPSPASLSIGAPNPLVLEAEQEMVSKDLFRLSRRPSPIVFRADSDIVAQQPPTPAKPVLALAGIIGGPPWDALIDGLPGRESTVLVHRGDTFGALRIGNIARDTVIVIGADTVWKLTLKRTWQ